MAPPPERVAATLGLMRNRGPDASGTWSGRLGESALTLLHTRLSIIDPDPRANQPFESGDGVIVHNGEIYNYLELRAELEGLGHRFRTTSDTEVIVESYRRWGEACVERFEGMHVHESLPLMTFLYQHATQPQFTTRFRWRVGSLAVWDNRCVQHYALNDYAGQRREMNRMTIKGDLPY